MNVKSPRKLLINPQNISQNDIPNFLKFPPPKIDIILKENVGNTQYNQSIPKHVDSQTISLIPKKKYSETNTCQNPNDMQSSNLFFNDENSTFLFSEDLFDDLDLENTIVPQLNLNEEPEKKHPKIEDQKVQYGQMAEHNEPDPYANIRVIPISAHNQIALIRAISRHPLTPIIERWINQKNVSKKTHIIYRHKLKRFVVFLIDQNVQYPTAFHFSLYRRALLRNNPSHYSVDCVSSVRSFFRWAEANGEYENITKWVYGKVHK